MQRWATMLPVSALLATDYVTEAAGDRFWFSATLAIGIAAGISWHWLYPRGFAERAWMWALVCGGGSVVLGLADGSPTEGEVAPAAMVMLGIVGGHLVAEHFGWQLRSVTSGDRESVRLR